MWCVDGVFAVSVLSACHRTTVVVRPHYAASAPQKHSERITNQPFTPSQLRRCAATELHFHYEELHFYYESCNFAFGSGII